MYCGRLHTGFCVPDNPPVRQELGPSAQGHKNSIHWLIQFNITFLTDDTYHYWTVSHRPPAGRRGCTGGGRGPCRALHHYLSLLHCRSRPLQHIPCGYVTTAGVHALR